MTTQMVLNGGFETGDFTNWTTYVDLSTGTLDVIDTDQYAGTYSVHMSQNRTMPQHAPYITQDIDLTDVGVLSFWYKGNNKLGGQYSVLQVQIDGTIVGTYSEVLAWTYRTVNTLAYTGVCTVKFLCMYGADNAFVDDISALCPQGVIYILQGTWCFGI